MFCKHCGSELIEGDMFCRKCGTTVISSQNNLEDDTTDVQEEIFQQSIGKIDNQQSNKKTDTDKEKTIKSNQNSEVIDNFLSTNKATKFLQGIETFSKKLLSYWGIWSPILLMLLRLLGFLGKQFGDGAQVWTIFGIAVGVLLFVYFVKFFDITAGAFNFVILRNKVKQDNISAQALLDYIYYNGQYRYATDGVIANAWRVIFLKYSSLGTVLYILQMIFRYLRVFALSIIGPCAVYNIFMVYEHEHDSQGYKFEQTFTILCILFAIIFVISIVGIITTNIIIKSKQKAFIKKETFKLPEREIKADPKKTRIKLISVLSILLIVCFSIVGFGIYKLNTFNISYSELDDGTLSVTEVSGGIWAKTLKFPEKHKGKTVTIICSNILEEQDKNKIEEIILPDSITEIYSDAFSDCVKLKSIKIPKNVTKIGENAFANCNALEKVYYNAEECDNLSSNIFKDCGGEAGFSCEIGSNVKTIPSNLFSCTEKTYDKISSYEQYHRQYQLYVVRSQNQGKRDILSFEAWVLKNGKSVYTTSNLSEVIFAENSICNQIGSYAFYGSKITTISIPSSVKSIENNSFEKCNLLESAVFEDSDIKWAIDENTEIEISSPNEAANCLVSKYNSNTWTKIKD